MTTSNQNTIAGSARQRARSRTGEALERGYVYLKPEAWAALHALARGAHLSASQYIASIIPAEHGTSKIKDTHDAPNTSTN
jgi:hypothetical protein